MVGLPRKVLTTLLTNLLTNLLTKPTHQPTYLLAYGQYLPLVPTYLLTDSTCP